MFLWKNPFHQQPLISCTFFSLHFGKIKLFKSTLTLLFFSSDFNSSLICFKSSSLAALAEEMTSSEVTLDPLELLLLDFDSFRLAFFILTCKTQYCKSEYNDD